MGPKTHRLIFSLLLDITPGPDAGPGGLCQLVVPLRRGGNSDDRSGLPRPPKKRTTDLRVGDDVLLTGTWRKVLGVEAYREHLLTESEAASATYEQGDLYQVPVYNRGYDSQLTRPPARDHRLGCPGGSLYRS